MKTTYVFLGVIAMLLYNVALIKRDQQLFKAYDKQQYCSQVKVWHPDCKIE